MKGKEILEYTFSYDMCQSIMNFSRNISSASADVFLVMSRKASCFITFLKRHGIISFDGQFVTDRILDFDISWLKGKSVVVIDDVIVSGTTLYSVIQKLNRANVLSIKVFVLGVNNQYFNPSLLEYSGANNQTENYLQPPYVPLSDAACMRICSNIVSTFALDLIPYDVDFPKHEFIYLPSSLYTQILSCSDWYSYDVSSDLQAENSIRNVTMIPSKRIKEVLDNKVGIPVSKFGFFKVRLFSRDIQKSKRVVSNAVPYFIFNEISEDDIVMLFDSWFPDIASDHLSTFAKIRVLQYVLAEKLFKIWLTSINGVIYKQLKPKIDIAELHIAFPEEICHYILDVIESPLVSRSHISIIDAISDSFQLDGGFKSSIHMRENQRDNAAVLQTKLVEPFTSLYFEKESKSRDIVLKYGKGAFSTPEYKEIIDRLNHGYSYRTLTQLLQDYPDFYDKETTVSLFLDEAIDAGVIVPIIATEHDTSGKAIYFRAYRHGEDVPFGELQEKLCAVMLDAYANTGGKSILSNVRIEKMLVLFTQISLTQHIFRPSPQDTVYYNVDIDSYIHGNVSTVHETSAHPKFHFLKHRTDAVWLSDILVDKGIIVKKGGKIQKINDNIDINLDSATHGKVCAIGQTFATLYSNLINNTTPYLDDNDLVLFSTCMTPSNIINALAAELAVFEDRWRFSNKKVLRSLESDPQTILDLRNNDMYRAINSGQKKFFHFINKDAQRRINEISSQLENSNFGVLGSVWEQFWPENRDWTPESLEPQMYNTILLEGKFLLILNLLCRLLFLCCTDKSRQTNRVALIKQIEKYQAKLVQTHFDGWEDTEKTLNFSKEVLNEQQMFPGVNSKLCSSICKKISDYTKYIPPLLDDVALLSDRHGKIHPIKRFIHAIHLQLSVESFADVARYFTEWFMSKGIEYQPFLLHEPSSVLPEQGIWFFLQRGAINNLSLLMDRALTKFTEIKNAQIYYNLSESLRLKVPKDGTTTFQHGNFRSYAGKIVERGFACKNLLQGEVCWFVEDSDSNRNELNTLSNGQIKFFNKKSESIIPCQTLISNQIRVYRYKLMTLPDKFREEYRSMKNKCKIFVSYSEDSPMHIEKIRVIVEKLRDEGFEVYFYEDEPFGTDMVRFMRNIKSSDITLIIGSPTYKSKALSVDESGASFEDRIIAGDFMSINREKIVPIAFGDFKDCIPAPFDKLKGMSIKSINSQVLDTLVSGLINRFIHNQRGS